MCYIIQISNTEEKLQGVINKCRHQKHNNQKQKRNLYTINQKEIIMADLTKERETIWAHLEPRYAERHFLYNEEYHPECLERLDERTIVITCNTRIKKIVWSASRRYQMWQKEHEGKEDDRVYRSIMEQEAAHICDCPMYSCFEEPWYNEEYTPSEDDYPDLDD